MPEVGSGTTEVETVVVVVASVVVKIVVAEVVTVVTGTVVVGLTVDSVPGTTESTDCPEPYSR